MFTSTYEMKCVAKRLANTVVIAALLLGSLEPARLIALPTHFV